MEPYRDAVTQHSEGHRVKPSVTIIGLSIIAALATMIGCSGGGYSPSGPGVTSNSNGHKVAQMTAHHRNFVIGPPSSGVYLGAYVNPSAIPSPSPSVLEYHTEQLESSLEMNRNLAMHVEYRNWKKLAALSTSDPQIVGDIAHHRVPIISWTCTDDIVPSPKPTGWAPYNLIQIANGYADADLDTIRAALTSIKAPGSSTSYPIMLRWFWEFNINAANPPTYANTSMETDNSDINGNSNCFVTPKSVTNIPNPGSTAPPLTDQFKNAWSHIYNRILGSQPVPSRYIPLESQHRNDT